MEFLCLLRSPLQLLIEYLLPWLNPFKIPTFFSIRTVTKSVFSLTPEQKLTQDSFMSKFCNNASICKSLTAEIWKDFREQNHTFITVFLKKRTFDGFCYVTCLFMKLLSELILLQHTEPAGGNCLILIPQVWLLKTILQFQHLSLEPK